MLAALPPACTSYAKLTMSLPRRLLSHGRTAHVPRALEPALVAMLAAPPPACTSNTADDQEAVRP